MAAAGERTAGLAAGLERRGVVTRPLDGGVRVTVGTAEENERFLAALDDVAAALDLVAGWDGGDR